MDIKNLRICTLYAILFKIWADILLNCDETGLEVVSFIMGSLYHKPIWLNIPWW